MSLILSINENFSVTTETVGEEKSTVIVIDNWLENADALRAYASQNLADWVEPATMYPGLWIEPPPSYMPTLMETLKPLIKKHFDVDEEPKHTFSSYSLVTKRPEELNKYQRAPHFDTLDTPQIAVLHYLCDESHGGTGLYRHKKTGYETINHERWSNKYRAIMEQELEEQRNSAPSYCDASNDYFEKIAEYKVKFDRLIVYSSALLHSPSIKSSHDYQKDVASGRLTMASFISYF